MRHLRNMQHLRIVFSLNLVCTSFLSYTNSVIVEIITDLFDLYDENNNVATKCVMYLCEIKLAIL